MSDPLAHTEASRELVREGLRAPRRPASRLIADLTRIADSFHFTATRVGQPGSAVRLRAAEDAATVQAAIQALKALVKQERAA